jgi:acyl carrier protein
MKLTQLQIEKILKEEIAVEVKRPVSELDSQVHFASHGLDSLNCIYVLYQVEKKLEIELNPSVFWDYPTIFSLAEHLHQIQAPNE